MMDFEKLREVRNNNNPFAEMLGITLTEIREGSAVAEMSIRHEYTNPVGSSHGGVLFTIADVAAGAAAASFGNYAVTVSSEYHFLNSAKEGSVVRAAAETIKGGKNIIVLRATVTEAGSGKLLGDACITYFRLDKKIEL